MSQINLVKQVYKAKKKEIQKLSLYKKLLNLYNYQKVKGYCPLEQVILAILMMTNGNQDSLDVSFNTDNYVEDKTWQLGVSSAFDIMQKDIPVYWLEKDWLKMMLSTDLPSVIGDFKIPFNEALLLLPDNLIISPDKFPCQWLYFKYIPAGEIWNDLKIEGNQYKNPYILKSVPQTVDKITWVTSLYGLIYQSTLEINQGEINRGNFDTFNCPASLHLQQADILTEDRFIHNLNDLILKMLLFLQVYPDILNELIVNESSKIHLPKNKKNLKRSPRWIKNTQLVSISYSAKGSHRSPKTHFRRGHIKRVAIGEGRKERKWIWIKPTIVNQ